MKKLLIPLLLIVFSFKTNAQVGIGNTNPQAQLDISASNISTPTNQDGILIPRIDEFPATNPTATQDGMMVFATGNGTPTKGFYYWDNTLSNWVSVTSNNDSDFYEIGSTNPPDNISDDIYTLGKIKIGQNSAAASPLSIFDWNPTNTSSLSISRSLNSPGTGTMTAISTSLDAQSTDNYFGIQSTLSGTTQADSGNYTASSFGTLNGNTHLYKGVFYSAAGTGRLYGNHVSFFSTVTNTGNKYGYYANIPSTLPGIHYGIYSDAQNATGYAAYFIGRTSLGETTTNRYLMPAADGTAGQILSTDGAGTISWSNPTDDGDWTINGNNVYKTTGNVGIGWNNSTYPLAINDDSYSASIYIDKDNNGASGGRGINMDFRYNGSGAGAIYGIYNYIEKTTISSNTGTVYGAYNRTANRYNGATSSNSFGSYNFGTKYTGSAGNSYGIFGSAHNESGTAAYGVYGAVSGGATTLYAGFFSGDVYATGTYLPSARQLKLGIQDLTLSSLDKLNQIKIKSYEYDNKKYDYMHLPKGNQVGVIADEMEAIFPELVKKTIHPEADENLVNEGLERQHGQVEFKAVNYTGLVPHLVKAIQELKNEIDVLKNENQQLKTQIVKYEVLEARLSALEKKTGF